MLFDYQKSVQEAGHLEAYNYWVLMKGDEQESDKWIESNQVKWDEFIKWFGKNKLQINLQIKITLMIDMSLVTNGKIDQEMMIIIIINEKKHTTIDVMTNLLLKIKKDMIRQKRRDERIINTPAKIVNSVQSDRAELAKIDEMINKLEMKIQVLTELRNELVRK